MYKRKELDQAFDNVQKIKTFKTKIKVELPSPENPSADEYRSFFEGVEPVSSAIDAHIKKTLLDDEFTRKIFPEIFEEKPQHSSNPTLAKFGKVGTMRGYVDREVVIDEFLCDQDKYHKAIIKAFEQNDMRNLIDLLNTKSTVGDEFLPFIAELLNPDREINLGQPPKFNSLEKVGLFHEITRLIKVENISYTKASERMAEIHNISREKIQKYYREIEQEMIEKYPWTKRAN
jgi:hypothetical protein